MRFLATSWGDQGPEIIVSQDFMALSLSFREAGIWHEVGHIHYEHSLSFGKLGIMGQAQLRAARIAAVHNGQVISHEAQADRFAFERVEKDALIGFLSHLLQTRPTGGKTGWNEAGRRELELRIATVQGLQAVCNTLKKERSDLDNHWYFAYGSNLDIEQMEHRTGKVLEVRRAYLAGYRIVFNKVGNDGTGKANIWRDETSRVWGVIYRCSPNALRKMDDYEGVPGGHYLRKEFQIESESGEFLTAVTYVAGEGYIQDSLSPAPDYLGRILNGARSQGLPEDYIQEIRCAAHRVEQR